MSIITDLLSNECIDKKNKNLEDITDYELRSRGYHRISLQCEYCTERTCHFCDDVEKDIVPLPHVDWRTVKR